MGLTVLFVEELCYGNMTGMSSPKVNLFFLQGNVYYSELRKQILQHETVYESNQQDATIQVNLLFPVSSTCFGRCFRPSSEEPDCIYSIW